jgi:hypothetical protein
MWKPKPLLILSLVVAGAFALVSWMGGDDGGVSEPALVFDRIWIDQLPRKPKDTFHTFIAATQEPIGLFHAGSQWKGGYEVFAHTAGGDGLRIVYLQTNETEKVKVRAWRCKEQGMDYCLELAGASRGVKRYRSMQGWEIRAATRPAQFLDRIASIARVANSPS